MQYYHHTPWRKSFSPSSNSPNPRRNTKIKTKQRRVSPLVDFDGTHKKSSLSLFKILCFLIEFSDKFIKNFQPWLVWLSWLEHPPINQKVMGSIPSQGTCFGGRFGPWFRACARGNWSMFLSHIDVYLPPSLPSPLSKINKHVLRWGVKKTAHQFRPCHHQEKYKTWNKYIITGNDHNAYGHLWWTKHHDKLVTCIILFNAFNKSLRQVLPS